MEDWSPVARAEDLPVGRAIVVQHEGEAVAVFNIEGRLFACSEHCPHAGGPLHLGLLRGTTVVCPWHGWNFDLDPATAPPRDGALRYLVRLQDGQILLRTKVAPSSE
ncbi:MAG: Rieske 2Fe-2S domain-containing protein [Candidatus Hydrogenedentes bacterium]|nr:Rieske 2Fe-2S domain-containing protein [Candidatus Hydrogenedentota bacterium]